MEVLSQIVFGDDSSRVDPPRGPRRGLVRERVSVPEKSRGQCFRRYSREMADGEDAQRQQGPFAVCFAYGFHASRPTILANSRLAL